MKFLKKNNLIDFENDMEIQNELKAYEKYIEENKKDIAKKIILDAIYGLKLEQPIINCCKKIDLSEFPNYDSDTIGQLLGKHGKHKQIFINVTKVDLEIDKDSKSAIVISKYNTIAVEKACLLIKKLLETKKLVIEKIEKLYEEVCKEWDEKCIEDGKKILKDFLKYEEFTENLAKCVGSLQHVYSFSQNILEHSQEVAQISANIAIQLDLDALTAKRAGFFHDIGKAIANYEDHVEKGISIGKEAGLDDIILNAIESHHVHPKRAKPNNPYSIIVAAADKLSAGRSGARPRQMEIIHKRVDMIEKELMSMGWPEKIVIKNAGNIIQIFLKVTEFSKEKIEIMKAATRQKLRNLNSEYSYNYQIEFVIMINHNFLLEEK